LLRESDGMLERTFFVFVPLEHFSVRKIVALKSVPDVLPTVIDIHHLLQSHKFFARQSSSHFVR
jgi:hypothetical protein